MTDEGFERAVREHRNRVHSHAVWLLRDGEEARDVSQEALVRLWRHRSDVPDAAARSWLLRTTHRLCLDRHRRTAARPEVAEDDSQEAQRADPAPDPERAAASSRLGGVLAGALERLAPRDRAIVLLREVEDLPYDEIAEALGIPLGTVKAALHRARERLRVTLLRAGVHP
ncbi:MAG: RNA polymerase sigma factor [Acidobacteriia bacterium]|jgi:RNA polymerase sigma-70 factor (ECF subfamily)|nr:RNA polymerase sigma factor [Terriglobia bacterium]